MTIEAQYATALYTLVEKNPTKSGEYLSGLTQTLERKGHQKLLSRILAEYRRIEDQKQRFASYRETTPEHERTRTLLELYRTLITS